MVFVGSNHIPDGTGPRLFLSCFWILVITLVVTFTGNMTAFATLTRQRLPVNSLAELAESPEYQAGVARGTSTELLFKVSVQGKVKGEC